MSCFRPVTAVRDPISGKLRVGGRGGVWTHELPCGSCVGCKMDRARAWSIRIGHEAQGWDSNLFVTFDYAPEFLRSWSLEYRDFQLFMKRCRKRFGAVRFFVAGEYGKLYKRPHWHAILFNLQLPDQEEFQNETFRSESLERTWGLGNCVIGRVTARSAAYVAGYTQSKAYGREAEAAYEDLVDVETGDVSSRRREFCAMSRRPGIGALWYRKFAGDLFPRDSAVQDGKEFKVPRFYFEKFKLSHPKEAEEVSFGRYLRSELVDPEESSLERRAVREFVAQERVELFAQRRH